MRALLGLDLPQMDSASLDRPPQAAAVASIEKTIAVHSKWCCLLVANCDNYYGNKILTVKNICE